MEYVTSRSIRRRLGQVYQSYLNSNLYDLDDCYTSHYSNDKYCAYCDCERIREKYHGRDMKITGYNGWCFQVGFTYYKNNCMWFAYITKDHNYTCEVSNII